MSTTSTELTMEAVEVLGLSGVSRCRLVSDTIDYSPFSGVRPWGHFRASVKNNEGGVEGGGALARQFVVWTLEEWFPSGTFEWWVTREHRPWGRIRIGSRSCKRFNKTNPKTKKLHETDKECVSLNHNTAHSVLRTTFLIIKKKYWSNERTQTNSSFFMRFANHSLIQPFKY